MLAAPQQELSRPPPPLLPQRKQRCLSEATLAPSGGSEAQRRGGRPGSCQTALGAAQLVPRQPGPAGTPLPNGAGAFGTGGSRGQLHQRDGAQTPGLWPGVAQRTRRPYSADPEGSAQGTRWAGEGTTPSAPAQEVGREVGPHPRSAEPHPDSLFSPPRSLLPPEPLFGAGDPAACGPCGALS